MKIRIDWVKLSEGLRRALDKSIKEVTEEEPKAESKTDFLINNTGHGKENTKAN